MRALEVTQRDIPEALTRLVGKPLVGWERLGDGCNSRVYKVSSDDGSPYLAKQYFHHGLNTRDRLTVEFSGLQFLWDHGVRDIPRPIAMDWTTRWAIYEFIEGRRVPSVEVTAVEIDAVVDFLETLKELTRDPASRRCPVAAEACFSIQAILDQLQERMRRFPPEDETQAHLQALHMFLRETFLPAWHTIRAWCMARMERWEISLARELREEEKTLSPSDFGFHNAIQRADGRLVFVDFEYFGWDDPAKTIVDVLFHPAMSLSDTLKQYFVTQSLHRVDDPEALARRVEVVYPLWGLKWCLILLNEFVPVDWLRRGFAKPTVGERREVYDGQLVKSRHVLQRVLQGYDHFPYDL